MGSRARRRQLKRIEEELQLIIVESDDLEEEDLTALRFARNIVGRMHDKLYETRGTITQVAGRDWLRDLKGRIKP